MKVILLLQISALEPVVRAFESASTNQIFLPFFFLTWNILHAQAFPLEVQKSNPFRKKKNSKVLKLILGILIFRNGLHPVVGL